MNYDNRKYVILPCLTDKMIACQATHVTLSEVSGVSVGTIHSARSGKGIYKSLAIILYQTLNERKFSYKKRGPKT